MKAEASPAFGDDLELQGVDTALRALYLVEKPLHRHLNPQIPQNSERLNPTLLPSTLLEPLIRTAIS